MVGSETFGGHLQAFALCRAQRPWDKIRLRGACCSVFHGRNLRPVSRQGERLSEMKSASKLGTTSQLQCMDQDVRETCRAQYVTYVQFVKLPEARRSPENCLAR